MHSRISSERHTRQSGGVQCRLPTFSLWIARSCCTEHALAFSRNMCNIFAQISLLRCSEFSNFIAGHSNTLCAPNHNYWSSRLSEGKQMFNLNYIIHTNNLGRLIEQNSVPQAHKTTLSLNSIEYIPEARSLELSSKPPRDNIRPAMLTLSCRLK